MMGELKRKIISREFKESVRFLFYVFFFLKNTTIVKQLQSLRIQIWMKWTSEGCKWADTFLSLGTRHQKNIITNALSCLTFFYFLLSFINKYARQFFLTI